MKGNLYKIFAMILVMISLFLFLILSIEFIKESNKEMPTISPSVTFDYIPDRTIVLVNEEEIEEGHITRSHDEITIIWGNKLNLTSNTSNKKGDKR